MMDDLRQEANQVILSVGDMIYDTRTRSRGFLQSRERRIDIKYDDIYVWTILWFSQSENTMNYNNPDFMEEEGLRMSVVIGTIILQTVKNGGNHD